MERLRKDQVIILYNIVNETESTRQSLGDKKQTIAGREYGATLAELFTRKGLRVFHTKSWTIAFQDLGELGHIQEVQPVARFTVRRLHNNDPITII